MLVLGVVGAVGLLLVLDLRTVHHGLTRAEARVESARDALLQGDVPSAADDLERARAAIGPAIARTRRPLWEVAERAPVLGGTFRTVTAIVDTTDAATRLGRKVITDASELVGERGRLEVEVADDGRVDLEPVVSARQTLRDLDTGRLERAVQRLEAAVPGPAPTSVTRTRERLLALANRTLEEASTARSLIDVLPAFLGDDGQRRYLLALQNPAELRGTGGLVGFYAVLTASDGKFELTRPDPYEVLDRTDTGRRTSPVPVSEEFDTRYGQANAAGFLANSNVDPDLPTVAPVMAELYRSRTATPVDGVIAVDPLGLESILREIGPVDMPDALATPGLPDPVPADAVAQTLLIDAYEVLGGPTEERQTYLEEFTVAAFDRVFDGGWDALRVAPAVARTALDGHLQLWSADEDEQATFEALRIAGALAPAGPDHDLLAVTGNNAAGNKADVFAAHGLHASVVLTGSPDAWIRVADLEMHVVNPLPTSGMDVYFLQSGRPGRGFIDGFGGAPGLNRTWFSAWAPAESSATSARVDGEDVDLVSSVIDGRRGVDGVVEAPSRGTGSFGATFVGPVELERDGGELVYRLTLHHQPKAVPDRLLLTVTPLQGHVAVAAEVTPGGHVQSFGPHGEPGPDVTAEVVDGAVRVTGDLDRTIDLEVRMRPVR